MENGLCDTSRGRGSGVPWKEDNEAKMRSKKVEKKSMNWLLKGIQSKKYKCI